MDLLQLSTHHKNNSEYSAIDCLIIEDAATKISRLIIIFRKCNALGFFVAA